MNRIQEINARLQAIDEEQDAVWTAAGEGNGLSEDQRTTVQTLETERTTLVAEKTALEADEQLRATHASRRTAAAASSPTNNVPATTPAAGGPVTSFQLSPGDSVRVIRENQLEDPNYGFESHNDFLLAVMEAGQNPGRSLAQVDSRLIPLNAAAGGDEQSTFADPYGGFLIPRGFSTSLMQLSPEDDPMGNLIQRVPMATSSIDIPARVDKNHSTSVSGGLRVYRRAEADQAQSSRMEMETVNLTAKALMGIAYSTEELLERSPISFVTLLQAGFRDEFASTITDERINGTGVGQFEGVRNSPAKISVSKETGQDADTILYENIVKMRARCWKYGRAIWIANHDTLPQLALMNRDVGTGGVPIWHTAGTADVPDLLFGRPIFFTEYCQTLGDAGDIMLVTWSEYLEGTLNGIRTAESVHVRFLNHERTFKVWVENDAKCWWRSALTPKNSTSTLSPIVELAARA